MAQETQYWSFRYILGTVYSGKTEASEISPGFCQFAFSSRRGLPVARAGAWRRPDRENIRMAADSTMFLMVNLLIALSLGVHREQLEQRMGLTWPRPFLLRPLRGC